MIVRMAAEKGTFNCDEVCLAPDLGFIYSLLYRLNLVLRQAKRVEARRMNRRTSTFA
jgi:hypothetical protein